MNSPPTCSCLPGHLLLMHYLWTLRVRSYPLKLPNLVPKASREPSLLPVLEFQKGFTSLFFQRICYSLTVCTVHIFKRAHTHHVTVMFSSLSLPRSWKPLWGLDHDEGSQAHSRHSLNNAEFEHHWNDINPKFQLFFLEGKSCLKLLTTQKTWPNRVPF